MAIVDEDSDPDAGVDRPRPWRSPARRAWDASGDRVRPWLDWFGPGRVAGAALTIVATVAGGWWLLRPSEPPTEATLPYASVPAAGVSSPPSTATVAAAPAPTAPSVVVVHVAGAVARPGVYGSPPDARSSTASTPPAGRRARPTWPRSTSPPCSSTASASTCPVVGEVVPAVVAPAAGASGASTPAGPVDLNAATEADLDALPGIGPATARAIVEHRQEHGPFPSVDALEDVRGIGPAKLDDVRDLVTT